MIIAIANQKGGVGKTTTTAALGVNLTRMGYRVLAVDADPQANLTTALGVPQEDAVDRPNLFTIVEELDAPETAPVETPTGVWLIPSINGLAHADLHNKMDRERILTRLLGPIADRHDVILIDSPPTLGLLTINALAAADTVIVPTQTEAFAVDGLAQLMDTMDALRRYEVNPRCEIGGVVLTMYDGRRNLDKRVSSVIRETLGDVVFSTTIPRDVRLAEYGETGDTALIEGESQGAAAYRELAKEVADRWLRT